MMSLSAGLVNLPLGRTRTASWRKAHLTASSCSKVAQTALCGYSCGKNAAVAVSAHGSPLQRNGGGVIARQIFSIFWKSRQKDEIHSWKQSFAASRLVVAKALSRTDTVLLLQVLFSRLYTLRNQLVHGNATWNGSVNRNQVVNGFRVLSKLQPIFLAIMMTHPHEEWGELAYPIMD